jgi:hypothetical protein
MTPPSDSLGEFDFSKGLEADLLVLAGGFEDRSTAFAERLQLGACKVRSAVLFRYAKQVKDNDPNYLKLESFLRRELHVDPIPVSVDPDAPIASFGSIRRSISAAAGGERGGVAVVDVSGLTHMWALGAVDACVKSGLHTTVVYTEAEEYYPSESQRDEILLAARTGTYRRAEVYLQSAGLRAIHILPEFSGNHRPDRQICLVVFVGHEPNRIAGLVDKYAPGALLLYYGRSPRPSLAWRTEFSQDLHSDLFARWKHRSDEVSTLSAPEIIDKLEHDFAILRSHYDIAVAPQSSKMQAVASYVFWRRHPEIQLIFTSPVSFNPDRYSRRAGQTYRYAIS